MDGHSQIAVKWLHSEELAVLDLLTNSSTKPVTPFAGSAVGITMSCRWDSSVIVSLVILQKSDKYLPLMVYHGRGCSARAWTPIQTALHYAPQDVSSFCSHAKGFCMTVRRSKHLLDLDLRSFEGTLLTYSMMQFPTSTVEPSLAGGFDIYDCKLHKRVVSRVCVALFSTNFTTPALNTIWCRSMYSMSALEAIWMRSPFQRIDSRWKIRNLKGQNQSLYLQSWCSLVADNTPLSGAWLKTMVACSCFGTYRLSMQSNVI